MTVKQFFHSETFVSFIPVIRLAAAIAAIDMLLMIILYAAANPETTGSKDRALLLFLFVLILYFIVYRKFNQRIVRLAEDRIQHIRLTLMDRIRHTDLRTFEQIGIDRVYAALTSDIRTIADVAYLLPDMSWAFISIMILTLYIATISWYAFGMIVAVFGIGGLVFAQNQYLILEIYERMREREQHLLNAVDHLLSGFKELRLNDKKNDDFFYTGLTEQASQYQHLQLEMTRYFLGSETTTYSLWRFLIVGAVLTLPLFGVTSRYLLVMIVGLILYMPIDLFLNEVPHLIQANMAMQRLNQLMQLLEDLPQEPVEQLPAEQIDEVQELKYEAISFRYPGEADDHFAVGPVSLTLQPGEIVFLTGGNGSGKSTLVFLLTGLYSVEAGQVFLNGQNIDIRQYRVLFSTILSDFHLFDRLYGMTDMDQDRVNELLTLMQIDRKVQYADGQFSTLDLSTGQKKRLALVCAMLEDKPIYVFDEWAAEQDPQFRRYFYETLLPTFKAQGKIVIAVTHDDRWFYVADRVLKMEYGQLLA